MYEWHFETLSFCAAGAHDEPGLLEAANIDRRDSGTENSEKMA